MLKRSLGSIFWETIVNNVIVITSYNVVDQGSNDSLPSIGPPTFYKPDDCSSEKALVQDGVLQAPHADYMSQ